MNKEQREYIKAQAELAAAEEQERKLEAEFLKKRGYDVASIYCIENESEFDRLNEEFAEEPEEKKAWDRVCKARDKKLEAEEKIDTVRTIHYTNEKGKRDFEKSSKDKLENKTRNANNSYEVRYKNS